MGAGTYTYVVDPTTVNGGTGTDEIKVAMIYKPSVLTCTGLATADNNVVHNRPPLAQTFIHNTSQEKFSVIVNHFKSKGCSGATGSNVDQNDGQSCFNDSRKLQATALLNFVNTIKNQSSDNDLIVMGDINAYEQEDPIDILLAGGMTHLLNNTYSYVFNGQSGSLDHALVSASLNGQVSGAAKWHINADEPICKDYNQEFNPAYMYDPGPYRSSDHDPLIVGLDLKPVTTGLENGSTLNANGSFFTIMPNPTAHTDINLTLNSNSSKSAEITLCDQLGKIVYNQTSNVSSGQNTIFLSLPVLNSGVYFVSVKMDGLNQTQKLLILK
jgi:predicted extracellular nuclease